MAKGVAKLVASPAAKAKAKSGLASPAAKQKKAEKSKSGWKCGRLAC